MVESRRFARVPRFVNAPKEPRPSNGFPMASVIIPNLDSPFVDRTLDAVARQRGAAALEVIVVGRDGPGRLNGRRDVTFVETEAPLLPGAARNLGAERAQGDVLVFVDADCVPEDDWLLAHLDCQRSGRTVVGGAVLWDDAPYWTLADNVSMFHAFDRDLPAGPRSFLPTLNLSVHRSAWQAVGTMDGALRCGEDVDWTIRAAERGHRPWFEPAARVWHRPPRASARDAWDHHHRSGAWMAGVRARHSGVLEAPQMLKHPLLLRALSPAVAAWATLGIFMPGRAGWRHPRTIPAIFMTKLAWCAGAARPVALDRPGLR